MIRTTWLAGAAALFLAGCSEERGAIAEIETSIDTEKTLALPAHYTVAESRFDHDETLRRLLQSMDRRDLTVFAVIDHQAGAQSVDLEMPPATAVLFGSPAVGTPLMKRVPELAAELPMRAAVYDDGGTTYVAMISMRTVQRAFPELKADADRITSIRESLAALVGEATGADS